jgi:colanic acid/amylovoran biosynthesis glycosyltransferase
MNVLMIGAGLRPPTFISRQIRALREVGVEVSLLPEFPRRRFLNAQLSRSGFVFHLTDEMTRLIRRADIVHYQWLGHFLSYHSIAKRFRKPCVVSLRGRQINILPHLPRHRRYAAELKARLPHCDAYHCVSERMLRESSKFGLRPDRAWVIRPAVDTSLFVPPPAARGPGPVRIAMVGALIWLKGYEYALLALRRVLDAGADVVLTIVGSGEEEDRVRYIVEDLGLQRQVMRAGSLSPEGLLRVLQEGHVFLHTSLSEGMPNVLVEAMATGLPVVTTDVGGVPEVVTDGREGYLVLARDVAATADRLLRLVRDPGLREAMGRHARQRAVDHFDLRAQGARFVEMYRAVLHR